MEQVQFIYKDLRDNNEIAIVEKYGGNAKQYTVGLTSKTSFAFDFFHVLNYLINFLLKFL